MKHVFITGATGFIGRYIAEEFVENGWAVTALVHKQKSDELETLAQAGKLDYVNGDVGDFESLRGALLAGSKEFDVIVHCAGRASDVGWRREFRRTNYQSVQHLVKLTQDLDVGRLVFVSTTDVYGLLDFKGESEDELALKSHPRNPYPEFKILAEQHIRNHLPKDRYAILRPAQVWGVGDTTLTPRIVDFLRGSPWIVHFGKWRGTNRWPLAHVRNVATAAYLAATLSQAAGQAINVVDSEHVTMDEFCRVLARIYLPQKDFKTITLPFWMGRMVGSVVTCVSCLFNLNRPFMDPSLYALYAVSCNLDFSNQKLQELFRIADKALRTVEQGIDELEQESQGFEPYSNVDRF